MFLTYFEIVGANLRGDRGEFFTPRNVMKMTVEMINPQIDEKVLDSSCGTGGFLAKNGIQIRTRRSWTEFLKWLLLISSDLILTPTLLKPQR